MTDRQNIRALIAEELLRPEIQDLLRKHRGGDRGFSWDRVLRHPLMLSLFAFLLTGIVGTLISAQIDRGNRERQARQLAAERAYKTEADIAEDIGKFVRSVYRRSLAGDLLKSAIERRSSSEILPRKRAYDEAYFEWNTLQPDFLYSLRKSWDPFSRDMARESPFGLAVYSYVTSDFTAIDACVTRKFDENVRQITGDDSHKNAGGQGCSGGWEEINGRSTRVRYCALTIWTLALERLRIRTNREIRAILSDPDFDHASAPELDYHRLLSDGCAIPLEQAASKRNPLE